MNQVLGTDKALRLNDFSLVGLVQTNDWNPEFAAQTINELGRDSRVAVSFDMETRGQFEVLASGNTAGLLARMQIVRDGAGKFTGFAYDPASSKNGYTITQTDLKEMNFDIILHEKPDQVNFSRSVWIPRAFLTQFNGRADANGNAQETFMWAGQFSESFPKPFHDIRSVAGTVTTGLTATLLDASVTNATHTLAYVMVDEKVFNTATGGTMAALDDAGVITLTTNEGYVIPPTAVVRALVYKTAGSASFPVLASADRGTSAFSIRGYNANIYIAPVNGDAPTLAEQWLKVQNVSWDVNLRVEALRQIAKNDQGTSIYARVPTFPIEITCSLSVVESDWSDWKHLMTKTFDGVSVYDNTYDFAPKNMKQGFAIVVEMFDKDGIILQRTQLSDMYIDGAGQRVNVSGRAEVTWQAKGSAFVIDGFDVGVG